MMQISLEDLFRGISTVEQPNKNIVLICDRGTMDGSAYVKKGIWNRILEDYDLSEHKLRDLRYDLIIHMSTAADGAEEYYTLGNNQARSESMDFAKDLDKKLQEAWINHPNFVQIYNKKGQSFHEKVNEVCQSVFKFIGVPTDAGFYKKIIIANPDGILMNLFKKENSEPVHTFKIKDIIFIKNRQNLIYYRKRKAEGL